MRCKYDQGGAGICQLKESPYFDRQCPVRGHQTICRMFRQDLPATDLTGKCGGCLHSVPVIQANGRYRSNVSCQCPEREFLHERQRIRQRTVKACKKYEGRDPHV